jgi:cell division septation protein DedD
VPTITALPQLVATQRATPSPAPASPTPQVTALATAKPEVGAQPPSGRVFWVQVLAASKNDAFPEARKKLVDLGFPVANQKVTATEVAGGNKLFKLRIGPFPDRESADRVVRRMQGSGFPDAWVVVP